MADLSKKGALSLMATVGGLIVMASNPNFEKTDLNPTRVPNIIQKHDSHAGFDKSGKTYVLGSGAAAGGLAALGYLGLTGGLYARRRREE